MDASPAPQGAVIEIIERTDTPNPDGIVVPSEVRINGIPLLVTEDGIKIHEMALSDSDAVLVTLTLFARRVVIGEERAS